MFNSRDRTKARDLGLVWDGGVTVPVPRTFTAYVTSPEDAAVVTYQKPKYRNHPLDVCLLLGNIQYPRGCDGLVQCHESGFSGFRGFQLFSRLLFHFSCLESLAFELAGYLLLIQPLDPKHVYLSMDN
jgi:hypothetical protein